MLIVLLVMLALVPGAFAQQTTPAQNLAGQLAISLAVSQDHAGVLEQQIVLLQKQIADLMKERDDLKAKATSKPVGE